MKSTLQKYKSVFSVLIYSQNHAAIAPIPEHVNRTLPGPWRSRPACLANPHASLGPASGPLLPLPSEHVHVVRVSKPPSSLWLKCWAAF